MPTPRLDPARVQTSTERAARARRALADREALYASALLDVLRAPDLHTALMVVNAAFAKAGRGHCAPQDC